MTTEEKQLLFKDICARLPYGIYCQIRYKRKNKVLEECKQLDGTFFNSIECLFRSESGAEYSTDYKPYLRPMSSMTEDEKNELRQEHIKDEKLYAECLTKAANGDNSMRGKVIPHFAADWCNKNHFDYRGLISMGLALEAPEDMYKTE